MASSISMDIIILCILPYLPLKSLVRFRCVSKSFLTEIVSPYFIKRHHLNALSSNANRLLILPGKYGTFRMFELDSLHSSPRILHYPIPNEWCVSSMSIVACCGSHIVIACGYTNLDSVIVLNPSTGIYHKLPQDYVCWSAGHVLYGMCHCSSVQYDDFKIVRFVDFYNYETKEGTMEISVYSLKTNTWKSIECESTVVMAGSSHNPVLLQKHLLHLLIYRRGDNILESVPRIGCFDMKDERWSQDMPLLEIILFEIGLISPEEQQYGKLFKLGVFEGQLCFSFYSIKSSYDIWIMKDYGAKESWIKLMSLIKDPGLWQGVSYPLAYHKGSSDEVLCIRKNGKCFRYNLRDKNIIEIADFLVDLSYYNAFSYICAGSLLNFSGGQSIKDYVHHEDTDDDSDHDEDEDEDEDMDVDDEDDGHYVNMLVEL